MPKQSRHNPTSAYDLTNVHGAPLCHAVGCRKHVRLLTSHGGLFCRKHLLELESIRGRLQAAKHLGRRDLELEERNREFEFRKNAIHEEAVGHAHYINTLARKVEADR